jgi:uncharacterized protein (DUF362 family)
MSSGISRRMFLHRSLATGSLLVAGKVFAFPPQEHPSQEHVGPQPDLAVVSGDNAYEATRKAVAMLGGMKRFVMPGTRAGLLVNSRFNKPGTFVHPQITLAVAVMLREAGVEELVSLEDADLAYWKHAALSKEQQELVHAIKRPGESITCALTGGVKLKEIEVSRDFMDCSSIINIAIFKDHEGTRFTGTLKNIMGVTSNATNRSWHLGSGMSGYYDDIPHLSQCIADGNLCRKPTLCIGDATEVILHNGPFGPGPTWNFRTIVAGTNPVSCDAFGASILGFKPDEILMIRDAAGLGIGSLDLDALQIRRVSI